MNRVDYTTVTERALKQIEQGAFLTLLLILSIEVRFCECRYGEICSL